MVSTDHYPLLKTPRKKNKKKKSFPFHIPAYHEILFRMKKNRISLLLDFFDNLAI
jgi:hypothetical protein